MKFEYKIVSIAAASDVFVTGATEAKEEDCCIIVEAYSDELEAEIKVENLPPSIGRTAKIGSKLTVTIEEA